MSQLDPAKLSVKYHDGINYDQFSVPRVYTLTHSDFSGELFLTIGTKLNKNQVSGWYTRLMRDEVWAEWITTSQVSLLVHCHISGGLVLGKASWRYAIFNQHMPMVLEAFRYGDSPLFEAQPDLDNASILVRYHSTKKTFEKQTNDKQTNWGKFCQYQD